MIAGAGTREANARIAAAYDAMPYDTVADENLDPERVLGLGAVYGATAHPGDVLDIGCGTGAQLARAGLQTQGRLAGIDLSQEACRRAREKLNRNGGRGEILQADILDIVPEHLGLFDLIYAVGVIFIVPPQVRRHILDLIGRCLKPGGVAVLDIMPADSISCAVISTAHCGSSRQTRRIHKPHWPGHAVISTIF